MGRPPLARAQRPGAHVLRRGPRRGLHPRRPVGDLPRRPGGGALLAAVGGVALLDDHLSVPAWIARHRRGRARVHPGPGRHRRPRLGGLHRGVHRRVHADRLARRGRPTAASATGWPPSPARRSASRPRASCGVGASLRAAWPTEWRRWMVGGACTATAYTLVLAAVRLAPVGYVTALRESSVVLGALAGWLVLHEAMGAAPRPPASSSPGSCCSWSSASSPEGSARVLGPGSCLRIFPAGLRARRRRPRAARGWPGCAGPSPSGSPASR